MKCLVTGGCGFIGSHLADLLLQNDHNVTVIDNLSCGNLQNLNGILDNKNFNFIEADIRSHNAIFRHFKDVDWVFHLAGIADIVPSIQDPVSYYENNVSGTLNVAKCASDSSVRKLVYAASSSCYGIPNNYPTTELEPINPEYPYALTKYIGEEIVMHWCKVYSLPTVSLRLFNVYGPRSRTTGAYGAVFGVFLAQKLRGKKFTVVGDGTQTRDFTYVSDVVRAFYMAAASSITNQVMNVGSGGHYSINDLVALLGGDCDYIPKRPGEPDCTYADISKISSLLNWKPEISFEEGVRKMLDNIELWREAPLWDTESIASATELWFKHLGNS